MPSTDDNATGRAHKEKADYRITKKRLSYCSILALICAKSGPIVRQPIATNNRQAAISTDSSQNSEFETRKYPFSKPRLITP
jgi:hypothetical protein